MDECDAVEEKCLEKARCGPSIKNNILYVVNEDATYGLLPHP
jgi:hypothetical protein